MKNKIFKIGIIVIILLIFVQIELYANTLTLNITTNKKEINVGDKFVIEVSWNEGMQAADFYLKYDSEKLEFVETDISEDYINSDKEGEIKVAWFSMDDTDKTGIKYTFKAKKSGTVELKTEINGGFATGELKMPEEYKNGVLILEIKEQSPIRVIIKILLLVAIVIICIKLITKKCKNKKYFK